MWNHAFMFSVTLYHPVRPYKHNFSLALYQQCAYAQAPVVLLMISKLHTFRKSKRLEEKLVILIILQNPCQVQQTLFSVKVRLGQVRLDQVKFVLGQVWTWVRFGLVQVTQVRQDLGQVWVRLGSAWVRFGLLLDNCVPLFITRKVSTKTLLRKIHPFSP